MASLLVATVGLLIAGGGQAAPAAHPPAAAQAAGSVDVGGGVVVTPEPGWLVQTTPGRVVLSKNGNVWAVSYIAPLTGGAPDPVAALARYEREVIAPAVSRVTTGVILSLVPNVPSGRAVATVQLQYSGVFAGSNRPLTAVGGLTEFVRADGSVVIIEARLTVAGASDPAIASETDRIFASTFSSV